MAEFVRRTTTPVSPRALYDWHASGGAFSRLAPPWESIEVQSWRGGVATQDQHVANQYGDISTGATITLRTAIGPIGTTMIARHVDHREGELFVDEMIKGPFAAWRHEHRFLPGPDGTSVLEDHIDYKLPLGPLGAAFGGRFAHKKLEAMFTFRHRRTTQDLDRHKQFEDQPRMTIAVSGASGLVGRQLCAFLRGGGHRVRPLVRRAPAPHADEIRWDPAAGTVDAEALEGTDAIIHLAGESIMGRWTAAKRERIVRSRVQGTRTIAEAAAAMKKKPAVILSTSAIGIYGDRGDQVLTEGDDQGGSGFLADTCRQWEAAMDPARDAGVRVVHPRLGVVLSGQGGALAKMLPAFQLGVGGPIGGGRQWMSWIGLDDLIGIFHHALFTPSLDGPVNAVAPSPVRNGDYGRTLGRVLWRPALAPLPRPVVSAVMGQMGRELLLFSANVSAETLTGSGFRFLTPDLEETLRQELGRF